MGRLWKWFSHPPGGGPAAIILIRLMAGGVFLWEGILKFAYHTQGGGRFALIGIPFPERRWQRSSRCLRSWVGSC